MFWKRLTGKQESDITKHDAWHDAEQDAGQGTERDNEQGQQIGDDDGIFPEQIMFEGSEKKHRKFRVLTKKNIIVLSSIALIGGAVCLNWLLFSDDNTVLPSDSDGTYYQSQTPSAGAGEEGGLGEAALVGANEETQSADEYFASTLISRQRARDEAIEVLQLVAENNEALQDVKDQAMAEITQIAATVETEANIETMITAKGFKQCIAVINNDSASIIVKSAATGLQSNEITQIKEIVCEQTGISPANVKIIERSGV